MKIELKPIGFVKTDAEKVPRHWTVSDVEGSLIIDEHSMRDDTPVLDIKPLTEKDD